MANVYSTSDSGLASFMLTLGYVLSDSYEKQDGRVWFVFDTADRDASVDVANFFSGEDDEVSASRYKAAERKLGRVIHDIKNGR